MKETIYLIGKDSKVSQIIQCYLKDKYTFIGSSRQQGCQNYLDLNHLNSKTLNLPHGIKKVIINAGITSIEKCENNNSDTYRANVIGTCNLINMLEKLDIKYLFMSSSTVFSVESQDLYEDSTRQPSCVYGMQKKQVEDHILSLRNGSILRMTKLIDPRFKLILDWYKQLSNNLPINSFKDLKLAPITPKLLASWIDSWIINPESGAYHISSSSDLSYFQLGLELASIWNFSPKLVKGSECLKLKNKPIYIPSQANLNLKKQRSLISPINDEVLEISKIISLFAKS